jgi:hypothetical protein
VTESEQQRLFAKLVGDLLVWIYYSQASMGWEITFGEAWRTPEQAALDASKGIGIAHSLHTERMAIDLNLWKNGAYTSNPEDYRPIGDYWKLLNPLCRWGGDFKIVDADHFSLAWDGRE